ncbi:MAG: crossover junction endodeoxyribonuclease RuvC [Oscillospiraceae bacterium]
MIILGVDPGYAIVGCGAVEYAGGQFRTLDYRAITTPAGMLFEQRLLAIHEELCALIRSIRPDAIAVEELFFSHNQTTGIYVAQARGVILLAAAENGVEPFEYGPMQVKQAVVGYGKAEKRQVMEMTRRILGLDALPKPDDVADALAIAICHGHSSGGLQRLQQRGGRL